MRPATFEYVRATTVDEAIRAVQEAPGEARLLAGGQTLVNLMRARTVRPSTVVDISGLSDLNYIRQDGDQLAVGALTRMCDLEQSDVVRRACPALAAAARSVGDPQVRNRATVGGNLLNPDPVSDIAPVLLASAGTVVLRGPDGPEERSGDEFFSVPPGTPPTGRMIVEVRFGRAGSGCAFEKLSRRAADAAVANAAAFVSLADGAVSDLGLALGAVHDRPVRAAPVEERVRGQRFDPQAALAALREFCAGLQPPDTVHGSAAYRREVAPVIALRALQRAVDQATRS